MHGATLHRQAFVRWSSSVAPVNVWDERFGHTVWRSSVRGSLTAKSQKNHGPLRRILLPLEKTMPVLKSASRTRQQAHLASMAQTTRTDPATEQSFLTTTSRPMIRVAGSRVWIQNCSSPSTPTSLANLSARTCQCGRPLKNALATTSQRV